MRWRWWMAAALTPRLATSALASTLARRRCLSSGVLSPTQHDSGGTVALLQEPADARDPHGEPWRYGLKSATDRAEDAGRWC